MDHPHERYAGLSVRVRDAWQIWGWGDAPLVAVASPFPLRTKDALIAYRIGKGRGKSWKEGDQYEVLLAWYGGLLVQRVSGAIQVVADALEISRQGAEKTLAAAEKDRIDRLSEAADRALTDPAAALRGRGEAA
jgi:hypothetical protein